MTAPAPLLHEVIRAHARLHPSSPALLSASGAVWTYRALVTAIDALAAQVRASGVASHDTVALALPDGPDLALAVLGIGACTACVPLHASWSSGEIDAAFEAVRPRLLIVPAGVATAAAGVARRRQVAILELRPCEPGAIPALVGDGPPVQALDGVREEAAMLVLQTSGTSGRPRFVRLTHRHVSAATHAIAGSLDLTSADRALSVMPLAHIHGLSAIFASLASGGSAVCAPAFSAAGFFDWLALSSPTWYTAAPAIHRAVLAEARARRTGGGSLRFIRSASAPLPRELAAELEGVLALPVIEAYGMTEASPQIASNRRPPHVRKPGSVGRPAGPEVMILLEDGSRAPAGATGEIAIRGDNVCTPGWLHTGDLGYVDADGDLFVTGRTSDVINRGGEKIAPFEIEAALLTHPDIVEAVAFAVPHPSLGESVAAAVVLRPGADVPDVALRSVVSARLAPFKMPHPIVRVSSLPVTTTGKLQRRLLAEHFGLTATLAGGDLASALTPLEATVAGILGQTLGRDALDRHTDFFLAGGDSLSATQAIARLRDACAVDLPLDALFVRPTVAELAAFIASGSAGPAPAPIPVRRPGEVCPLSSGQQRLWLLDQLAPGSPAYNMQLALRLSGPLDVAALEQSLGAVRERHESLRTTFPVVDGQVVQQVAAPQPMRLPVIDLQSLPSASRDGELARLASDAASTPFNLARGPLFQALLVRLDSHDHALLLTMHHIVSDGWSMRVLQRELRALYTAAIAGEPSPLPPLRIQFPDVAAWERAGSRDSASVDAQRAYWMEVLAGLRPNLDLPIDRVRPAEPTYGGARLDTTVPSPLVDRLRALARRHDATLFMTTLAAFQALLARYAGQDNLAVGTPIAGRRHADTEPLIGFFANTLVLRANLSDDPSFADHLRRTRQAALGAFANQDLPFEQVVEALQPPRQPGRTPLFQVMFAFQNLPEAPADLAPGLMATPIAVDATTAKFDLTLYVTEDAGSLCLGWQYNADLLDAATIGGMAASFGTLVAHVVEDAACPVSALPLGQPVADVAPLEDGETATEVPLFADRFREHVARTPDAVAVSDEQRTLTYAQLDHCAASMARALRTAGLRPGAMAGVCVTRSVASAVALLGIWRAGGVYVPFDPAYPSARLAQMAADAGVVLLIADATARPSWPDSTTPVIDVEDALAAGADVPAEDPVPTVSSPAYVIYTSGSTGPARGVTISHGNVAHYLDALQVALGIGASDRYLHTASFAFSSSVRQWLLPLASGAAVVVASHEAIRDPRTLLDVMRSARVTVIDIVPSYWRELNRVLASAGTDGEAVWLDNDLRLLLSASEPLLTDLPHTWRRLGQRARLVNMYGQTETTGIVSVHEIGDTNSAAPAHVPAGRPLRNVRLHIRDTAGRPVPDGVVGEIVVSGPTVGLGYRDRPEETARRFVLDPVSGARVYATGDRGRRRADGTIVLLGRSDRQVKLRGFRIEPGEIEAVLATHPLVHDSAVVMQPDNAGRERLVAYVVPRNEVRDGTPHAAELRAASIREFLASQLPQYMVPALVVVRDTLPLTPTGKRDRTALATAATREPLEAKEQPGQPAEQLLSALWSRLLGRPTINADDNFFDLGGDSLLGLQMIDEANRAGLRLTPAQLFQFQTVSELARASRLGDVSRTPPPAVDVRSASPASADVVRVSIDSARAFGIEALTRAGLDPAAATAMTEVQIEASLRGQPTHNLGAIPRYARRVLTGVINRAPQMRLEHETPTSALLDADNAAGQLAALRAMDLAVEKASRSGIGIVGVTRSNHFGAAGHYVWRAATQGVIGLCTTNSALWLAPTGGLTPLFGTNPLGVGVPSGRHHPIVLDVSMSVTAKGKVALELAEGRPLAPGWILDRTGRTSIDPADLIAGLGVPIGGHKGYGLALTMEILAGVLTGAGFGADHRRDRLKRPGVQADFGHCFIAIDPGLFMSAREFTARVDRLIDDIKQARRMDGVAEILLPGESEMRARDENLVRGLPLSASVRRTLEAYQAEAGLTTPLLAVEALADV